MAEVKHFPSVQKPPAHLQSAGRALWTSTLADWQLDDSDLVVLQTAAECLDRLGQIRAALDADGIVLTDPSGRQRAHPLLSSESQIRGVLLRAWHQLGLNDDEGPKIGRPVTRF
jgi:phage terminase small subunit